MFMGRLFHVAFRELLLGFIWNVLTELSLFFRQICLPIQNVSQLQELKEEFSIRICNMRKYFPHHFLTQWNTWLFIYRTRQGFVDLCNISGCTHLRGMYLQSVLVQVLFLLFCYEDKLLFCLVGFFKLYKRKSKIKHVLMLRYPKHISWRRLPRLLHAILNLRFIQEERGWLALIHRRCPLFIYCSSFSIILTKHPPRGLRVI